ncbi:alpha/beta hydrolase [Streptomyces sp. NRRL F-5755]|uniref:alpha/beta fold hydrolase n=1 Tax=Streptomyces sp. NRRL F-5755 TaxID=1519475 RepID=UPI0006AF1BD1|nr:alpha/beta hydrolase [Streptomyces sp. NRRL F-5755]KOU09353.1 alpha/beta hydrolase [Streptomyces sp. NRRL F-5755]
MAGKKSYVIIPGAGGVPWDWHLVEDELRRHGHDVVAVDLPNDDPSAGLAEYADAVVRAAAGRTDIVLVAHSLGGFTAPLVCERIPVARMVLVAAMLPAPGESPGDWWQNTGHSAVMAERERLDGGPPDESVLFHHDVPPELAAESVARGRAQADGPFGRPWPLPHWPQVPTSFLLCRDDRLFPAAWLRGLVRERLGIEPEEMDGGHCAFLSRPRELAERVMRLSGA